MNTCHHFDPETDAHCQRPVKDGTRYCENHQLLEPVISQITCSCGKQTIVRFVKAGIGSEFKADDPGWMCWQGVGWFCGEKGHRPANFEILETGRELYGNRAVWLQTRS